MLGIAARELRSGLSGFRIFIACVALGVMVITGVGAVSDALRAGFERQGEAILGGDATLARTHVRAVGDERAVIDAFGRVSETATMRTMARRPDGGDQALAELKGVDAAYPLVGTVEVEGGKPLQEALRDGAVVDPALLERLKLKVGDQHRARRRAGEGRRRAEVGAGRHHRPADLRPARARLAARRWRSPG